MFGLSIKAVIVEVLLFLCYEGIVVTGIIPYRLLLRFNTQILIE